MFTEYWKDGELESIEEDEVPEELVDALKIALLAIMGDKKALDVSAVEHRGALTSSQ